MFDAAGSGLEGHDRTLDSTTGEGAESLVLGIEQLGLSEIAVSSVGVDVRDEESVDRDFVLMVCLGDEVGDATDESTAADATGGRADSLTGGRRDGPRLA